MAKQRFVVNINTGNAQAGAVLDMSRIPRTLGMREGEVRTIPKEEWLPLLGYTENRQQRAVGLNFRFIDQNNNPLTLAAIPAALRELDVRLDDNEDLIIDLTNVNVSQDTTRRLMITMTFV